jgi:hypothetical protein
MSTNAQGNPHWIAALLAQRRLPLVVRTALVTATCLAGIKHSSGRAGVQ